MRPAIPLILFGVSLLLGAAILYEAIAPLDPVAVTTPSLPSRHGFTARVVGYTPPPLGLYADIDQRPLFSQTRQPLADKALAVGGATSDLSLVGVIMGGARAVALLRNKSTSSTTSAAVGDLVNGWRVLRIDATTVTLRTNSGDFVVAMEGPADRPPSAPLQAAIAAPTPAAAAPQPSAASPPPQAPAIATSPPAASAVNAPAKPALPVRPADGTISPEALKSAPIDPRTGEPTL